MSRTSYKTVDRKCPIPKFEVPNFDTDSDSYDLILLTNGLHFIQYMSQSYKAPMSMAVQFIGAQSLPQ